MRLETCIYKLVDYIPESLEEGVLYARFKDLLDEKGKGL